MEIIELKNVCKTYPMGEVKVHALQNVSLKIRNGEFIAITGSSGSGKSTLMHLAGCLDKPTTGAIYLSGKKISDLNESQLAEIRGKKMGFIFQQFNLIQTLTALENVTLPMEFQDSLTLYTEKKAEDLLNLVGLKNRMYHRPTELSGGESQRVAIARALANDPEVIIADEPTGNLDSRTGNHIIGFLSKLNKKYGKTIIMISHNLDLVKYANRIIKLKDGKIQKDIDNHKIRRKK